MSYVYCYGMVHPSKVYLLTEDYKYPEANGYGEVDKILTSIGGEAVNTAIMLDKLGIQTKLDGTWIVKDGFDDVQKILSEYNIDFSRLNITEENGASEILISDGVTRTCFGNFDRYKKSGKKWNVPDLNDIKEATMVALDPYFDEESYTVAKTCMKYQIPYLTIDVNYDDIIAQESEVLIISVDHREWNYLNEDLNELFNKYTYNCKGLIIFTFGDSDIWYGRSGESAKRKKPYSINVVDSTGAGDSFRAGIIYGLLNDMKDDALITFANAVAACVCLSVPHTLNAYGLKGILDFIESYPK